MSRTLAQWLHSVEDFRDPMTYVDMPENPTEIAGLKVLDSRGKAL